MESILWDLGFTRIGDWKRIWKVLFRVRLQGFETVVETNGREHGH